MATIINPITTVLLNRAEFTSGDHDRFPFKYILEDDGTISYYSTLSAGRYLQTHEAQIPGLGVNKKVKAPVAEIQPLAHGFKVPGDFFHQIKQFFLDVMGMGPSTYEAQVFIIWNETSQDYRILIPKQTVSAAAVRYDIGDTLAADDRIIVDIHSHNDMSAFFSGTDNADDKKNPWISGVFGKLSTDMQNKFRFNDGCGRHFDMVAEDVFDFTDARFQTPKEWIDQVEITKYSPPKVNGVRSWAKAYGYANGSKDTFSAGWSAPNREHMDADGFGWADLFDPSADLYDGIVDTLNDADNLECKIVLQAVKCRIEDPRHVPELSERESGLFIEIDFTVTQAKDDLMAVDVINQLLAVY